MALKPDIIFLEYLVLAPRIYCGLKLLATIVSCKFQGIFLAFESSDSLFEIVCQALLESAFEVDFTLRIVISIFFSNLFPIIRLLTEEIIF